jgi:hypothetical protein
MRLFSFLVAVAMIAAIPSSRADDPKPKPTASPEEADKSADFDIPVPMNIPVKGIKIPHRNEEGKLIMTIEAETAKKLDEKHVEMENMKIDSYDDDGKTVKIEIPHSIFDLDTRILSGDSQTLIRRDDFEITGDSVEFNTKTRHATLRGKIHMIIQSADIEK